MDLTEILMVGVNALFGVAVLLALKILDNIDKRLMKHEENKDLHVDATMKKQIAKKLFNGGGGG